jgi:phosphatidylglycerol:prolipoprotein diacylglycerol transferase
MTPIILPVFPKGFHIWILFIHFYALAYICGILLGWKLMQKLSAKPPVAASTLQIDDFLTWATLGIILGGRLGYVLFYQPLFYLTHPIDIIKVWDGGMSFHGGFLGVMTAIIIFCRRERLVLLRFADRLAVVAPIGICLGRLANFINGELWGRQAPAWFPFAMVYPGDQYQLPRYPSELIEAALEGVLLFLILLAAVQSQKLRDHAGILTGLFVSGYAIARITSEFFREPDSFLGFLPFGTTMGQILSVPMFIAGVGLILWGARHNRAV